MKNNQMCAIIVDELNDDALKPLTNERPLGTLFFDCKYRLIDFELSSVVNAGIRNVQLIEDEDKVRSVFDHLAAVVNGDWMRSAPINTSTISRTVKTKRPLAKNISTTRLSFWKNRTPPIRSSWGRGCFAISICG